MLLSNTAAYRKYKGTKITRKLKQCTATSCGKKVEREQDKTGQIAVVRHSIIISGIILLDQKRQTKLLGNTFLPSTLLASSSNSPLHHPSSGVSVTAMISPAWKSNSSGIVA